MNSPLVTICCTTYNHEKFIRDAIEGFLIQETNFPFEIIIHDDASTDGTAEIVKEYAEKHPDLIFPIYQKENQYSKGIKPWPNFVFPRARGKYIALCEGDDYWTDKLKLQKQVGFLEGNVEYVVTYHDAKIVDENGDLIKESKLPEACKRDFSAEELKKGAWLLTLSMCFRNVIREFPNEMLKVKNGDTFLISLLGNYGKGKYLGSIEPAIYRAHEGGVWSKKGTLFKINSNLNTLWKLRNYYKRIGDKEISNYFKKLCEGRVEKYLGEMIRLNQTSEIFTVYNSYLKVNASDMNLKKLVYLNKCIVKFLLTNLVHKT